MSDDAARHPTALVTGASSGIGRACAEELARRGFDPILVARRGDRLQEIARMIHDETGRTAIVHAADLTNARDRRELIAAWATSDAIPDVLVNNAGMGSNRAFVDEPREKLEAMVGLNTVAAFHLLRSFAGAMAARGSGSILNVASIAGIVPTPWHGVYSATKAAILSLSEALHSELKPAGVVVTAVCPGVTDTEFFDAGEYDTRTAIYRMNRMSPRAVAGIGLDAMEKGRMTVVAGFRNKLLIALTKWLPYGFVAWAAGRTMRVGRQPK